MIVLVVLTFIGIIVFIGIFGMTLNNISIPDIVPSASALIGIACVFCHVEITVNMRIDEMLNNPNIEIIESRTIHVNGDTTIIKSFELKR